MAIPNDQTAADRDLERDMQRLLARFADPRCRKVEELMGILSNGLRYRILCALRVRSFTPSQLAVVTRSTQSLVSQQLKIMVTGDYVSRQRDGKTVRYSLKQNKTRELIRLVEKMWGMVHLDDSGEKRVEERQR